jgi:hypothetical protein
MTKINLEKIILIIFFGVILFSGPGALFDHKIKHDFPFAYGASDAFQHQIRAESIKDIGNFRYEPPYLEKGVENIVGVYPPVVYHLAAIFSYASGTEVYDSIYFIVVFFSIIASFVMYLIIRNFNKTVALLSLPLSILIFSFPLSLGFLWGHWPSVLSQSFLILFAWSIMRIDLDKSFLIIALSLSAIALTHTSEAIFALIFLALFFGIKILVKKFNKEDIKNAAIFLGVFFVISFYYLVIFQNSWAKSQAYEFGVQPIWDGNPGFYLIGFGLLLIPIIIGIVFSLTKLKSLHASIILAFAMLISGFLNYIGFGLRSFQIRFYWPIYLSVFAGFGIYAILKIIVKKWNSVYTPVVLLILTILILGIVPENVKFQNSLQMSLENMPFSADLFKSVLKTFPQNNARTSQGIMDPYHWESLTWISDNAEPDAIIYFFYGDIYDQDALLRNSKRVHHQVDPGDFINALQERKIKRSYISEFPGDAGGGTPIRSSFFNFENAFKDKPGEFFYGPRDICTFDYLIFDKVSRQEVLAQYNVLIAQELLKKESITLVFDNQFVFILKNSDVGADCIEERSF